MKKLLFFSVITVLLTITVNSYSQVGITSYSVYAFGINSSTDKKITAELKAFANRPLDDLLFEAAFLYNFKPASYHRFSAGLGLNAGPFRGFDHIHAITVPVQIEIFPLQDFKKLSLLFELCPEFIVEHDPELRTLWGIRYSFGGDAGD
jgi:hypothetical protein